MRHGERTGNERRSKHEFDRSSRRFPGAHPERDPARHQKLDVPASKLKTEIARILKEEGYIANYKATKKKAAMLRVYLKYGSEQRSSPIPNCTRVSRPGCRVYVGRDEISASRADLASAS